MPDKTYSLLDVHLPDELGALARLARTLAEAGVNISGFVANRGGVQVLTRDSANAERALRESAYHFRSVPVREVTLEGRTGSLANLSERLAWDWTSIDTGIGLTTGRTARVFLQVHEQPGVPATPMTPAKEAPPAAARKASRVKAAARASAKKGARAPRAPPARSRSPARRRKTSGRAQGR